MNFADRRRGGAAVLRLSNNDHARRNANGGLKRAPSFDLQATDSLSDLEACLDGSFGVVLIRLLMPEVGVDFGTGTIRHVPSVSIDNRAYALLTTRNGASQILRVETFRKIHQPGDVALQDRERPALGALRGPGGRRLNVLRPRTRAGAAIILADLADEAQALAGNGTNQALLLAGIPYCVAHRGDPARKSRFRNDPSVPDVRDQIILGHNARAVADKKMQ